MDNDRRRFTIEQPSSDTTPHCCVWSSRMEPVFQLIIKDSDGTYGGADDLALADFGGVEPKAGDLYSRTVSTAGGRHRQTFRVLYRVFKEHRIGVVAEWTDDLP